MMKNKEFQLFGLLAILLMWGAAAQATYYLPQSSLWQGSRLYNENGVDAYVEYAVYDTSKQNKNYHNVMDGTTDGFANPGSGRYIYAYQVFNIGSNDLPIATFELLSGAASLANGVTSKVDGHSGIMPTTDGTSFIWNFAGGVFMVNKHSAFMVFSSNIAPTAGKFKLSTMGNSGDDVPTNGAPEPTTIALFATGTVITMLARRRRKLCLSHGDTH